MHDPATQVPAIRSLLSPEAVGERAQRDYAVGRVARCTLLRTLTNDVYEIETSDARYALKVYGHGWRTAGEIAWEVDLLDHLARKGLAIATAIPRVDGALIATLAAPEGPRHVVLFPFVEGAKPRAPSSTLYRAFGRVVAQIHHASDDFATTQPRSPLDMDDLLDQSLRAILPRLRGRPDDHAFVSGLAAKVRGRIAALAARGLDWGVCHGDVTLDNVHVTGNGQVIVYDFDSAAPGWRAADPFGVMTWVTRGRPEYWDAFLGGYLEVRALTEADRAAIPWLVPVQLLDNVRFHLTDWVRLRGALSLSADYLDGEVAALRRWDRDVLDSSMPGRVQH